MCVQIYHACVYGNYCHVYLEKRKKREGENNEKYNYIEI